MSAQPHTSQALNAYTAIEPILQMTSKNIAAAKAAMEHWENMIREYGEFHPVTLQAFDFFTQLKEKASISHKLGKSMVEATRQEFGF